MISSTGFAPIFAQATPASSVPLLTLLTLALGVGIVYFISQKVKKAGPNPVKGKEIIYKEDNQEEEPSPPHTVPPGKRKASNYRTEMMAVGFLLGYPISYLFQYELLRALASFGDYMTDFVSVLTTKGLGPRALLIMLLCAVIGAFIGSSIKRKTET